VGAVCPNWARTALCGGREVTRVPTAIQGHKATSAHLLDHLFCGGEQR
jgi:hypothetical protein